MNWIDGITCSVLRDGDAVAELRGYADENFQAWAWNVQAENGSGVGVEKNRDAAKAAAERAIRTMRGEGEG